MLKIRDQGASNGCTVYSIVTINNLQNMQEFGDSYVQIDPKVIYGEMVKKNPKWKDGVYFNDAIDWMAKKGYITRVAYIDKPSQIRKAIDMGCYPLVFIKGVNRKKTGEQKRICWEPCEYGQMKREDYSHAFSLVGPYTPDGIKCAGSRGEGRGDNGYFTISREDVSKCIQVVAIIDKKKGENRKKERERLLSTVRIIANA